MLSNLKIKIEGTPRSTPCNISKNEKEIVSNEHTHSDTISSVPAKEILNDELPEIKRFVENSEPYVKDFNEKSIPTKVRPIQMNTETVEFCKKEINDLLEKKLIRNSKSP